MPQPSPAFGSAPTAPRWSRLCRICRRLRDDRVALAVLHVGDEADAAGILLVARIVEALRRGQAGIAQDETLGRLAGIDPPQCLLVLDDPAHAGLPRPAIRSRPAACATGPRWNALEPSVMLHRIAWKRERGVVARRPSRALEPSSDGRRRAADGQPPELDSNTVLFRIADMP